MIAEENHMIAEEYYRYLHRLFQDDDHNKQQTEEQDQLITEFLGGMLSFQARVATARTKAIMRKPMTALPRARSGHDQRGTIRRKPRRTTQP